MLLIWFNLTYLNFSGDSNFNHPLNNLPSNLIYLFLGSSFNQSLNNLPKNLTHLTFGIEFAQKINLSTSIKYLKLNCNNMSIIDNLPDSLEILDCHYQQDYLPYQ